MAIGDLGECAANCSVNNEGGKMEKNSKHSPPTFQWHNIFRKLERCDRVTGDLLHAFVVSCIILHNVLLKFLNK